MLPAQQQMARQTKLVNIVAVHLGARYLPQELVETKTRAKRRE